MSKLYDIITSLPIDTDAYKGFHFMCYPEFASKSKIYIAPRKPLYGIDSALVPFGFSYFVATVLKRRIKESDVLRAKSVWDNFNVQGKKYPFPLEGWMKIVHYYKGVLPVKLIGLPEGYVYDQLNKPIAILSCDDPDLVWLPGWMEASFQSVVWSASTVATKARFIKSFLKKMYDQAVDPADYWTLDYRLHDFGSRGTTVREQSALMGLADLISFNGTDTMSAVMLGNVLYNMPVNELASSIVATEHSIATANCTADYNTEKKFILSIVDKCYEHGYPMFAYVSDTYDYITLIDKVWCDPEVIKYIKSKGIVPVVRPDSGDPKEMVLYALDKLSKAWGFTVNSKGYKVLNGIAVIQGDGMRMDTTKYLYEAIIHAGYSPQNLATGMGGGLLQNMGRDDMSWSMKLYELNINGVIKHTVKTPKTDMGKKAWNPKDGFDEHLFITYYDCGKVNKSIFNFKKIRERAKV